MLFEVTLELCRVDELLTQFLRSGFADCNAGYGTDSVGDTVAEAFELGGVELPFFDRGAVFLLAGLDALEDFFVVFALRNGGGFVLLVEVLGYIEGQSHALLAGSGCSACAVRVGFCRLRQVEVEDAGNVSEVDTTGDTELAVSLGLLSLLAGWLFRVVLL